MANRDFVKRPKVEAEGVPSIEQIKILVEKLPRAKRSDLIDELLDEYCTMCAAKLQVDGNCPDGCDPEEMLEGSDEDDEEDGDGDDEEDEDDATEEEAAS